MKQQFRPWGAAAWLFGKLPSLQWSAFAVASTEERCLALLDHGEQFSGRIRVLEIRDPIVEAEAEELISKRRETFIQAGVPEREIVPVALFADMDTVQDQVDAALALGKSNICLDISAMPKRWFFPLCRALLKDESAKNVVVMYGLPEKYGQELAQNPEPMRALPGFPGDERTDYDVAVIGVGFEPLAITSLFELQVRSIGMLFPFPPGPPGVGRNWMFVKHLEDRTNETEKIPSQAGSFHVNTYDCPQMFDAIREMGGPDTRMVLAPYGPKTMSLAMCLISLAASEAGWPQIPAYYAQPKRYLVDYSSGIKRKGGVAVMQAYAIKLNGQALYTLPAKNADAPQIAKRSGEGGGALVT